MNDKEMLNQLYEDMYNAMVKKDEAELLRVHDDSFVLVLRIPIEIVASTRCSDVGMPHLVYD